MLKDKVDRYFLLLLTVDIVGTCWCFHSTPEQRFVKASIASAILVAVSIPLFRALNSRSEKRSRELLKVNRDLEEAKEELKVLARRLKTEVKSRGKDYRALEAKIKWTADRYGIILEADDLHMIGEGL